MGSCDYWGSCREAVSAVAVLKPLTFQHFLSPLGHEGVSHQPTTMQGGWGEGLGAQVVHCLLGHLAI